MKNKTLSFLLAVLMSMVASVASAHRFEVGGIYYNITSSTNLTVSVTYRGDKSSSYSNEYTGSVTIPKSVTYSGKTYSVTSIEEYTFYNCTGLTSVTIPNSVTSIGSSAFGNCSGLTAVEIPNSVTSIGFFTFQNCSGLTVVTIPNSVTSIGGDAFYGCTGLTAVYISDLATWCGISFTGASANPLTHAHHLFLNGEEIKDMIIPDDVISIGNYAFRGCSGLTSIKIPNSVTSIGEDAFNYCTGLTSITIGNSVTEINNSAFSGCTGLTSIEIPNSVTSIGSNAFYRCSGLTSIEIPNSVTSIGENAFYGTAWYNNQPDGLVYAGKVAYKYKGRMPENTSIVLEEGTLGIAACAFQECTGLTSITIPSSVTSIGDKAFHGCYSLTDVYCYATSLPITGNSVFYNCFCTLHVPASALEAYQTTSPWSSFEPINIAPEIIDGIYYYFSDTNAIVTHAGSNSYSGGVVIPKKVTLNGTTYNVTLIGEKSFNGCTDLASVTIPNSVTSIGNSAFYGCI